MSDTNNTLLAPLPSPSDLRTAIETWLQMEIANGDPRADTVDNYRIQLNHWVTWCEVNSIDIGHPSRQHVEAFRRELVEAGMAASTIAVKLTVVRQFYKSAVIRGLIATNPATDVHPPVNRKVRDRKKNLNQVEAAELLNSLSDENSPQTLRDRAIIALALLEGLRRVELHRANVEDIEEVEYETVGGTVTRRTRILIHGKRRDRWCYPRADTVEALREYLDARGAVPPEEAVIHNRVERVVPMFCGLSKAGRSVRRISRRGLNWVVDGYLSKAGLKKDQISCHALRHSCGYMTYKETKDLRAVQDTLGHATIATAAIYAASDHEEARYTEQIPLKLKPARGSK